MPEKHFNCKYPVMLAAMNQVSTLDLAVAASLAGIFPSLSSFNYFLPGEFSLDDRFKKIRNDLEIFNHKTKSNNIVLSIEMIDILQESFIFLAETRLFSHIEILDQSLFLSNIKTENSSFFKIKNKIDQIKNIGVIPIFKCIHPLQWETKIRAVQDLFDIIILKSGDGAGTVIKENRTEFLEEFKILKNRYQNKLFIPTGGISTPQQVKDFIDAGAVMVGVGSYFTTASECKISDETKQRIINSTSSDITTLNNQEQNALVFSKVTSFDKNQTKSLIEGIHNPDQGHVFMSKSIDNIKYVKPIKDLVDDLLIGLQVN
jgi:NAD(P)H-dependent flavin oxidoreductase YrpB (nitropropane dioxygenase family)